MSRSAVRLINVVLCLAVVYIHVVAITLGQIYKAGAFYAMLYAAWRLASCVVQGFVFLSAYKLFGKYKSQPFQYGAFLRGRFIAIYVAYVLWSVVYYVYFCSLNYYTFSFAQLIKFIILGDAAGHLYFVPMLFQFYLLMPLWLYVAKRVQPALLLVLSLMVTVICGQFLPDILNACGNWLHLTISLNYNDRLFTTYLIYWITGMYAAFYADAFARILAHKRAIFITCAVIALLDVSLSYSANVNGLYAPYLENMHVLYCMSMILSLGIIAERFTRIADSIAVRFIDGASYYIYLSHVILIYMCQEWFAANGLLSNYRLTFFVRAGVVYLVSIAVCGLYVIGKSRIGARISKRNIAQ